MADYKLTSLAETDLAEIADYTIDTLGIEQARRYRDGLETCFRNLAPTRDRAAAPKTWRPISGVSRRRVLPPARPRRADRPQEAWMPPAITVSRPPAEKRGPPIALPSCVHPSASSPPTSERAGPNMGRDAESFFRRPVEASRRDPARTSRSMRMARVINMRHASGLAGALRIDRDGLQSLMASKLLWRVRPVFPRNPRYQPLERSP